MLLLVCLFFFFKQKTAYEMRISDWSSDVCSSELRVLRHWARGVAVYTITVRYSKHGMVAMNLKADTISLAREKALHMKSQAFHVEIKDALGQEFPLHAEE